MLAKLQTAGLDTHKVVVGITESTAMADPDRAQKILAELQAWGLTLARLKHLPVDILKIDRSFIRDVNRDTGLASMVRGMIQLAEGLGMVPLAEGIETAGELAFPQSQGCPTGQGFYFAKPVPAEEVPPLVTREGGLFPNGPAAG